MAKSRVARPREKTISMPGPLAWLRSLVIGAMASSTTGRWLNISTRSPIWDLRPSGCSSAPASSFIRLAAQPSSFGSPPRVERLDI
jgi:hypothetical protein